MHTWQFDATDGVYKSHTMSDKMLHVSVEQMKFVPFTEPVNSFGKKKGETITLMHLKRLAQPSSAQLAEGTKIPIDKIVMGSRALTLVEWGRGVEYSNLYEQFSEFDMKNELQRALIDQMDGSMDTAAAAAFMSTDAKICFVPTSLTGGTFDTDGTPSVQATVNLTFDHMGIISDYMVGDLHVPPYEGDRFVGLFARKALRGLKQDRLWQQVHMYLQKGDLFFKSETGMAENIRCVEVSRENALSNGIGAGSCLGEGVVFGREGVARAEAETPELRADPNYQGDFGRTKAMAWYGIVVFGTKWDTANDGEAKIVKICSN